MTTHAYFDDYIHDTQPCLADMLDYAVNVLNYSPDEFFSMFIESRAAEMFGEGHPKFCVGMSGVELARWVVHKLTSEYIENPPVICDSRTPEYWAGWSLAYYQWNKNIAFEDIQKKVPVSRIINLYNPLHEADITKFISVMDELL